MNKTCQTALREHAMSRLSPVLQLAGHAIILTVLTAGIMGSIYHHPRGYTSGHPGPLDITDMTDLCAHPGAGTREWSHIIIHHSATTGGSAAAFERFHIHTRHWDSLGYHFVIGNGSQTGNGEIEVGPRWEKQEPGSHANNYNEKGLGVCLVGNYERTHPTEAQLESLRSLLLHLATRYKIPPRRVIGHNEGQDAHTACPGKNMRMDQIRQWLADKMADQR